MAIVLLAGVLAPGCGTSFPAGGRGERGFSFCACADDDCDRDGLNDGWEDALATRFAPQFEQDAEDVFLPAGVPWFLERARLRMHHNGNCPDSMRIDAGARDVEGLVGQTARTRSDPWPFCGEQDSLQHSWRHYGFSDDHFFLELDVESSRRGDPSGASWTCYAHVGPSSAIEGGVDVQYWLFWPYNDSPLREHEGDWEHVTVRAVPGGQSLHSVYFAAHAQEADEGGARPAAELVFADPNTVRVYVARGSHAMYPAAGGADRPFPEPNDSHRGGGRVIDCRRIPVRNVGELDCPRPGQEWILFGGRWGEMGRLDVTSGPPGPARQGWWNASEQR